VSGRLVLDTNALIDFIGGNPSLQALVSCSEDIFIPSPALGELYFGAYRSGNIAENLDRIDRFILPYTTLLIDEMTAKVYGALRQQQRSIGRPIPNNDFWIAALAIQHDASVTTMDRHFSSLPNLRVVGW
jgi:tRNA(fMet)-specific endonuclease VapC